jgi:membrane protease YdiL (CAAX protease family)
MIIIGSINVLFLLALSIFGIYYSIKHRRRFVALTNFQINRKTILVFLLMGLVGAVIMFFIFLMNKHLGLIKIESTKDWISSLKQIPENLISSFVQEVIFRILVFITLIYLTGNKFISLLISSIVFCLAHAPMDAISVLSYFLAGLMYGLTFLKFKSIWPAVGLHFTWNYFQGAIFGFPVSRGFSNGYFDIKVEDNWIWNGGEIGPEGSALGVLCRIIVIIIILSLAKKFQIQESGKFLNIEKIKW